MGRQDHRRAPLGEPREDGGEVAPRGRVETDEGLVEQQRPGLHGEHAGERQAALLAAGERVRVPRAELGARQPDESRAASTAASTVVLRPAQLARAEGDVLRGRWRRRAAAPASGTRARPRAAVAPLRGRVRSTPSSSTRPCAGSRSPRSDLQQRRLARPRGPEQGHATRPPRARSSTLARAGTGVPPSS